MRQKIKLAILAQSNRLADKLVTLSTRNVTAENCFWRVHKVTRYFLPALDWIYTHIRPKSHHYTFRLQIYKLLLSQLQKKYHGYKIPLRVENKDVLQDLMQNQIPSLIISPHLRLTTILGYHLEQQGYRLAVLANGDPNITGLNFGMKSQLEYIPANLSCLLEIRRHLRSGIPVLAMPDYEIRKDKNKLTKYISPNLFKMAEALGAAVTFMWVDMEKDGTVVLRFKRLHTIQATEMAEAFRCFVLKHSQWNAEVRARRAAPS